MSANQSMITELAAVKASNVRLEASATRMEAELAELKAMLQKMAEQSTPVKAPRKRASKAVPEGEEKEKRPPSAWVLFSTHVQKVLMVGEESLEKSERTRVGTFLQFASTLWSQTKASGKQFDDEEIKAAWENFTPPEVSKQSLAGKSKRSGSGSASTGSGEESEPVADEKKTRKPQSAETKAAAAAKRAATNAAKKAAAAAPKAEAEEAEAPKAAVGGGGAEAAPAPAPKPKTKITAKGKKTVDLFLDPFEHDGKEYLKNSRGDVTSAEGEWVGHWTGSSIDESAPEPADFDQLTTRD